MSTSTGFTVASRTVVGPAAAPLELTELHDGTPPRLVARFTRGARSVCLCGPRRRFDEATAAHAVTHRWWVRALPEPFDGRIDRRWLRRALAANEQRQPDLLALAMDYVRGSPQRARYGPGSGCIREEGAAFNDYLGVEWQFPGESTRKPRQRMAASLDCSGYLRMVWGYRTHAPSGKGLRLSFKPRPGALPRRSAQMFKHAPGVSVIRRSQRPVEWIDALQPGDLLFFDADCKDGSRIDHVGMLLGRDAGGRHRFISSRKCRNGPTLGDFHGASVIDQPRGHYAKAWRGARRL